MKKLSIAVMLIFFVNYGFSQNTESEFPQNEVNFNIANTIAVASVEVGYEYFFDFNQSVGVKFLINDRRNYHNEKKGSKFHTNSVRLDYTYYFDITGPGTGFYARPMVKYRFGDFKEKKVSESTGEEYSQKTDMNSFLIGVGGGYVWNFSNNFIIGPFVNIARGFSSEVEDRFSSIEWNAGVNIGYRF